MVPPVHPRVEPVKVTMTVRYTRDHEYVRIDDGIATLGVTDYAQRHMGDVTFVELPRIGVRATKGAQIAMVESIKAASDISAPLSGDVIDVNAELEQTPGMLNDDPFGEGWLLKIAPLDMAELDDLLDEAAYASLIAAGEAGSFSGGPG